MNEHEPVIAVQILLGAPLESLASTEMSGRLAQSAASRLAGLADDLGIPGHVTVHVDGDHTAPHPIGITVHGKPAEYARSLDQQVLVACRHQADPGNRASTLPTWDDQLAAGPDACMAAITEVAGHAIAARAFVMLGEEQVAAWRQQSAEPLRGDLGEVLGELLGLRLSVRDVARISAILAGCADATAPDAAEQVIEEIRPRTLEIRVEPAYLAEIAKASADSGHTKFPYLRDRLYLDLGLRLPSLRLVPDARLGPRCYVVRVNHLDTAPIVGPPPGMCLINAPAVQISQIVSAAVDALNPATDVPGAFVPVDKRADLEALGYTAWDPLDHLVLALAEVARAQAGALIDHGAVTSELDRFRQVQPILTSSIQESLPLSRFTRLLRSLLDERVPVRDLRQLAQELSDRAVSGLPESDDQLHALARLAYAGQISSQLTVRGSIVVYLLDPSLEEGVMATDQATASDASDALVAAFDAEIRTLPHNATRPLLLTTQSARLPVRRAIATAWPRVPVLCYQELDPAVNVLPLARLAP